MDSIGLLINSCFDSSSNCCQQWWASFLYIWWKKTVQMGSCQKLRHCGANPLYFGEVKGHELLEETWHMQVMELQRSYNMVKESNSHSRYAWIKTASSLTPASFPVILTTMMLTYTYPEVGNTTRGPHRGLPALDENHEILKAYCLKHHNRCLQNQVRIIWRRE